jgi:hypothetical protein
MTFCIDVRAKKVQNAITAGIHYRGGCVGTAGPAVLTRNQKPHREQLHVPKFDLIWSCQKRLYSPLCKFAGIIP